MTRPLDDALRRSDETFLDSMVDARRLGAVTVDMVQELKLMADYSAWPLWLAGENVDPAILPISREVQDRLKAWSETYDAILNRDDPASSGFPSPEAERAWEEQGRGLWRDLQHELGAEYIVSYFSETQQRVLNPNDGRDRLNA